MADSRLQQKLRERRERAELEAIADRLGDMGVGFGELPGGEPAWVGVAIGRAQDIHTEPDDVIGDGASAGELDAWMKGTLYDSGVVDHFYVKSHVTAAPWVECRVGGREGWGALVRAAVEEPWIFLSADLSRMVVISETEYHFAAYKSRA
ncbi:hypothetical protein SLNWT_4577 [Streptomyces albus]|uniref:Uncharacterized protein n=1 Tax=Streptomyces albus (strain ATCC 21838 / DSM 41398 / FERM P-419 / JCM 4703 / NBRC 107858) TaxID=1081613 RepID=A0A0B5EQB0_STRA4|nr:hypothetical protein SLNWT_4577 [Streptomyces albus]AOU79257.1 hypothetical protein SLNHY_4566 [Streptomyces albus]AYN34987.1 hypothetical protein DUI70_4489 [Streptomyces albus]